ncbi:MAG: hypothetical protein KDA47_24710, partial [Planctomycetales bacterium]|nr:hypothetical protein [Planctomycetales bacterium]
MDRVREVVALSTSILKACVLLIIVLVLLLNLDLLKTLVGNVRHVELFGVRLDVETTAPSIVAATPGGPDGPKVTTEEAAGALKRASQAADLYGQASILWIDDTPENNLAVRRAFRELNATVRVAVSTAEA